MPRIYRFNTGVKRAVKLIQKVERTSKERPILCAVYGLPDSGKSYLQREVYEQLSGEGYNIFCYEGTSGFDVFQGIAKGNRHLSDEFQVRWVVQFHQGVERQPTDVENELIRWGRHELIRGDRFQHHDDPNVLSSLVLGRKMDLNFGIFNPNNSHGELSNLWSYNLVISNPDARWKWSR